MDNYYAYEYSILMTLQEHYCVKSITIGNDTCTAYDSMNFNKLATLRGDRCITLNFDNDFHFTFNSTQIIYKMFTHGTHYTCAVSAIKNAIEHEWLKRIRK